MTSVTDLGSDATFYLGHPMYFCILRYLGTHFVHTRFLAGQIIFCDLLVISKDSRGALLERMVFFYNRGGRDQKFGPFKVLCLVNSVCAIQKVHAHVQKVALANVPKCARQPQCVGMCVQCNTNIFKHYARETLFS